MANTIRLVFKHSSESLMHNGQSFMVKRIINVFPIPDLVNNPRLCQNLHIMGKRWLCDLKLLQDLAGAHLAAGEHIYNAQSLGIGHGPEHFCGIDIDLFHFSHLTLNSFYL